MTEFSIAHKWVFVSFSGGKDSTASYLKAIEQYPKHIVHCIFTETGYEHPETYEYIRWFNDNVHPVKRLASRIVREKNGRRYFENITLSWDTSLEWIREHCHTVIDEFEDRHQRYPSVPPFPSGNARHCTKTVKVRVFERHIRSIVRKEDRHLACCIIGIRRGESDKRAGRSETGINTDCGHDEWYPIVDYTLLDTFRVAYRAGLRFNEVYRYSPRSNCVFCPFARMDVIKATSERHEGIMDDIIDFENRSGWSLQHNRSVGESCSSGFCEV